MPPSTLHSISRSAEVIRAADGRSDERCWRCCSPSRPRYGQLLLGLTGQRIGIVSGQCGKTGSGLLACCQRGSSHVPRGCSRRSCAGRTDAQCLLEPAGKIAAQNGTAEGTAAGARAKRQRHRSAKNSTASDLHRKNLLQKRTGAGAARQNAKAGKVCGCSAAGRTLPGSKTQRTADGFDLIVTILAGFVKRSYRDEAPSAADTGDLRSAARMKSGSPHR